MMKTLGSSISKWLFSESDKCKDIQKKLDEKYACQQRIHAYIPETWRHFFENNHGQKMTREEAQQVYDKVLNDMWEKYQIDVTKLWGYGLGIARLQWVFKMLYAIIPMNKDAFAEMTDILAYISYIEEEFNEHIMKECVENTHKLFRIWEEDIKDPNRQEFEYGSLYNSVERVCHNLYFMWQYCANVLDIATAILKDADGIISTGTGNLAYCRIDDVQKLIYDLKEWAIVTYSEKYDSITGAEGKTIEEVMIPNTLGEIVGSHQLDNTTAEDCPLYNSRENDIASSITLIIGLAILLVISKILFPKLFIPIIVIVVILEILNNVLPRKKG